MAERITLDGLKDDLVFFNKMYDAVRLVDPVRKSVLEYRSGNAEGTGNTCYDYWKNGHICGNCISVRAYNENKSFMKLEHNPDEIMLVTAIPVETLGDIVVLELFKNAEDSMLIGTGDYNEGEMLRNVVDDLNNMVVTDSLTYIYNRRFMDERLPMDIVKATLAKQPLSVIFIDLDDMKVINDTYGHVVGDYALKLTADAIGNAIRTDMDWAARYGGDEFFVCLHNTGDKEASHIAERIRRDIAAIEIPAQGKTVRITASFGTHTMFQSQLTAEEMIQTADSRMYGEKRNSRKSQISALKNEPEKSELL